MNKSYRTWKNAAKRIFTCKNSFRYSRGWARQKKLQKYLFDITCKKLRERSARRGFSCLLCGFLGRLSLGSPFSDASLTRAFQECWIENHWNNQKTAVIELRMRQRDLRPLDSAEHLAPLETDAIWLLGFLTLSASLGSDTPREHRWNQHSNFASVILTSLQHKDKTT